MMKSLRGYVIGAIIGGLLVFSGQALAETTSLIGKKVQAENTVIVDGKELPVKAVNIGGTTFAPVRSFAEALGSGVDFKDNTVILSQKEGEPVDSTEATATPDPTPGTPVEMSELDKQIAEIERIGTENDNKAIELLNRLSSSLEEIPNREELIAEYNRLKEEGKSLRKQYDELVAQRAALQ